MPRADEHEFEIIPKWNYEIPPYAPADESFVRFSVTAKGLHSQYKHIGAGVHISPQNYGPSPVFCSSADCPVCERGPRGTEVSHILYRMVLETDSGQCGYFEVLYPWFNTVYQDLLAKFRDHVHCSPITVTKNEDGYLLDCNGWHIDPTEDHEPGDPHPPRYPLERFLVRDDGVIDLVFKDGKKAAIPLLQRAHLFYLWDKQNNPKTKLPGRDIWITQEEAISMLGFDDQEVFWASLKQQCFREYSVDGLRRFYHRAEIAAYALNLKYGLWVIPGRGTEDEELSIEY